MSRTRTEPSHFSFLCPLVARPVQIDQVHRMRFNRSGEEVARVVVPKRCSDMNTCPVARHHDHGASYDWEKCAFYQVGGGWPGRRENFPPSTCAPIHASAAAVVDAEAWS